MIDQPLVNNIPEGEPESLNQYEENKLLKVKVAELEQENHTAKAWLATCLFRGIIDQDCLKFTKNLLAIRDLEQKIEVLDDFEVDEDYGNSCYDGMKRSVELKINELREQINQLKGATE